MTIKVGETVRWHWGQGEGQGKVKEIFTRKVSRKIKGSQITRNGSADDPAVLIQQEGGDRVLKLASELV